MIFKKQAQLRACFLLGKLIDVYRIVFLRSFLFYVEKKRTKETPLKGKRVLLRYDILSPLRIPLTVDIEIL